MSSVRNAFLAGIILAAMGAFSERATTQHYGRTKDGVYIISNFGRSLGSVGIGLQKRQKNKWPSPFGYTRRFTRMRSYKGRR